MTLINEKELENVCGGKCILNVTERTAKCLVLFGAFIGVCALAKLTPSPKKNKKVEKKSEKKQVLPSKVVHTTKTIYYYR